MYCQCRFSLNILDKMSLRKMEAFRLSMKLICISGLICMVGYWLYKFGIEDRDIGVVDYQSLDETDVGRPVLAICVKNPFLDDEIRLVDSKLNDTIYEKYLIGDLDEPKFHDIEYENVSLDLNEYLVEMAYYHRDGSRTITTKHKKRHESIFNGIINGEFVKCFSPQMETKETYSIKTVKYVYNKSRIFNDLGDSVGEDGRILISLYYPGQFLMKLDDHNTIDSISMWINAEIDDIEFLRARKKRSRDCMVDWKSYDALVLNKHIEKKGCIAPYHGHHNSFLRCRNKTERKRYVYDSDKAKTSYYPPPCHRISKLRVDFDTCRHVDMRTCGLHVDMRIFDPHSTGGPNLWIFLITYHNHWMKIIEQSKEVDIHSLIGNIGGYVGLFLGNIITS